MTIRNTQKKGFTITTSKAEVLLADAVEIRRKEGKEEPYTISSPGEYDVAEVTVLCNFMGSGNDQSHLAYLIQIENITVGYLPNPPKSLPETKLPDYEMVQILLVPGDKSELVSQIAAPVVIPIDNAETLSKELATDLPEKAATYTIKSSSELPEETELIYLG